MVWFWLLTFWRSNWPVYLTRRSHTFGHSWFPFILTIQYPRFFNIPYFLAHPTIISIHVIVFFDESSFGRVREWLNFTFQNLNLRWLKMFFSFGPDRSPPSRLHPDDFDIQQAYHTLYSLRPLLFFLDVAYILFVWKGANYLANLKLPKETLRQVSIIWNAFNAITSLFMFLALLPEFLTSISNGKISFCDGMPFFRVLLYHLQSGNVLQWKIQARKLFITKIKN
jgi:hypothetical protein